MWRCLVQTHTRMVGKYNGSSESLTEHLLRRQIAEGHENELRPPGGLMAGERLDLDDVSPFGKALAPPFVVFGNGVELEKIERR
jgi:hypothetical protein